MNKSPIDGHETDRSRLQFLDRRVPTLDRKSTMLSTAVLWNKAGVKLGSTKVTDEIDFIEYGGGIFRRGEWVAPDINFLAPFDRSGGYWLFEQCETPITFSTRTLDP